MLESNRRPLQLMLLALTLLASGCATKPSSSPPASVAPARILPLSPEARQPLAPPWCSPNCSSGLSTLAARIAVGFPFTVSGASSMRVHIFNTTGITIGGFSYFLQINGRWF